MSGRLSTWSQRRNGCRGETRELLLMRYATDLDATDLDLTDLSPRNRRIFEAGVSGADGEADAPEGDPDATVEGDAPAADATVEGDAPAGDAGDDAPAEDAVVVLPELPADLADTPAEALQALHTELGAARDQLQGSAASQADLDLIREATTRREAIAREVQRRIDERRAVDEGLAALTEELASEAGFPEHEMALASMAPRPPTAGQIAAARGAQSRAGQEPVVTSPARPKAALVAAVSGADVGIGNEMNLGQLGQALDRVKRGSGRTVVASIQPYDEMAPGDVPEALSNRLGPDRNTELMREAQDAWRARQRGDVRAAAICEPLDIIRPIPDAFNTAEPAREAFPSRPAGRLGFTFTPSVDLSAVLGSTGLWTEADQATVDPTDPDTWKPCLDVECGTPETIIADAVTACLTWDITTEMSSPEHVQNLMNALNAARARLKEGRILQRIDLLSHHYTYAGGYGAVPTLIAALNTVIAQAVYGNRLDAPTYTVFLPPGLVQLLTIDLAGRAYDTGDVTNALGYVRDRVDGVASVVSTLDASSAGEPGLPFNALNPVGAGAVPLPSLESLNAGQHRIRLVEPGAGLYAETGDLNVGTTRDPQLLRQNKVQYFAEEFLLLAKNGPEPWFTLDVTLCPDGARAGLLEPIGCVS